MKFVNSHASLVQDLTFQYAIFKCTFFLIVALCTKNDSFEVCFLMKDSHEHLGVSSDVTIFSSST